MKLKKATEKPLVPRGRPRAFDTERALDCALKVFWRKGYEGTSLPDLTRAMGINRPSLYAAFGNKESLFRKAMDRYTQGPAAYALEALNEPTARAVVDRLLQGSIDQMDDRRNPRGCLLVQGGLACGESAQGIRKELAARRELLVVALRRRFERARSEGDLSPAADSAVLARYIATLLHGMSIEAASGASVKELRAVAETAMRAWPT
jgi:AcrR family transcriptional regulator